MVKGRKRQVAVGDSTGEGAGPRAGLIARCRRGEESAWGELYRTHQDRVIRFLRSYLGPVGDLDDLVQQVFMEMARSLPDFKGESSLNTWMFSIVRNVAKSHLRGEYRRDRRQRAYVQWADLTGSGPENPASRTERSEVLRVVWAALDGMDAIYREAWLAVEVHGLNSREAARVLGTYPGTVRSRLRRAKADLLEAIERAGLGRGTAEGEGGRKGVCVVTKLNLGNGPGKKCPGPRED